MQSQPLSSYYNTKLPSLVSNYLKTNNEKVAQTNLAKILNACSNHALEFGKSTSLWELKHDCEHVIKDLKPSEVGDKQGKESFLRKELSMSLKGIDNRIKSEWAYYQRERAGTLTIGEHQANTAGSARLLHDPILNAPRGLNETQV